MWYLVGMQDIIIFIKFFLYAFSKFFMVFAKSKTLWMHIFPKCVLRIHIAMAGLITTHYHQLLFAGLHGHPAAWVDMWVAMGCPQENAGLAGYIMYSSGSLTRCDMIIRWHKMGCEKQGRKSS